jgi:hypothetical protein
MSNKIIKAVIAVFSRLTEVLNNHISIWHASAFSIIMIICSIASHNGGIAHPEIQIYLPYYLSDKPLINKLFDSKVLDMDMFQAREASYLFDYLDCKFIELSVRLGHPHFLSLTSYIFLFITSMIIWHFSARELKIPPPIALLNIALFWTSPSIFFAGNYFRSSKVGTALGAAILFLLVYKHFQITNTGNEPKYPKLLFASFFLVSLTITLFDRQGYFIVGSAIVFILFWEAIYHRKINLLPLFAVGTCLLASTFYNIILAPWLTYILNQYHPNFAYQQLPLDRIIREPLNYIAAGASIYIDTIRFMIGNIPPETVVIALILLTFIVINKFIQDKKQNGHISISTMISINLIITNIFILIGLNALMVLRHPPLVWEDVRRVYYWIPEATILLMTIILGLSFTINRIKPINDIITALLLLAVIGNLYALPMHKSHLLNGHLKEYYISAPDLLNGLRNVKNHQYLPTPETIKNPIYQWFVNSPPE